MAQPVSKDQRDHQGRQARKEFQERMALMKLEALARREMTVLKDLQEHQAHKVLLALEDLQESQAHVTIVHNHVHLQAIDEIYRRKKIGCFWDM